MEKCVVTGAAGFIGSHIAERLLSEGYYVTGIDCLSDYYPRTFKMHNLSALGQQPNFSFIEDDLLSMDLNCLGEAIYIFHQAAQPGVRKSWGTHFPQYTDANVLATQRLLEVLRSSKVVRKFIYASSSSVYGDCAELPLRETARTQPVSPYGVTKLAGEHLVYLYNKAYGLPTVSLRYFTVYGPRQRPDMAFCRFLKAIYAGQPIELYGDGNQTRDFTFVDDIIEANMCAMNYPISGRVFNIGGDSPVTVNHCLELLAQITGISPIIKRLPEQAGDVLHTWADVALARKELGYQPTVKLEDGLAAENTWFVRERLTASPQRDEVIDAR